MAKIILVHRWEGEPGDDWYPWLKEKLEEKGHKVLIPQMPETDTPKIEAWVSKLQQVAKPVDNETHFVGHSVGCQTILRFLETLPQDQKVGRVILVAPWLNLTKETMEEEGTPEIAGPWIETPIRWEKVKNHTNKFVTIFSSDDPYVPLSDIGKFEVALDATILMENKRGHFTSEDGVLQLPGVLRELIF